MNLQTGELRLRPKLPILAIIAGVVLVISSIVIALAVAQAREQRLIAADGQRRAYEIMVESRELRSALKDAEIGSRGFIIIGSQESLQPYTMGVAAIPQKMARLEQLAANNPRQQSSLRRLATVIDLRLDRLRTGVELAKSGASMEAIANVRTGEGVELMNQVRLIISDIDRVESELMQQRSTRYNAAIRRTDWLIGGLLLLMTIMAAFGLLALIAAARAQTRNMALEAEQELARKLKAADAAAARSAAIVAALGEAVPDLIFAKDREGRMTYANPSTLAIIGKPLDELIGLSTAEFNPNAEEAAAIDANDARVMANGVTQIIDEKFTSPDGRLRTFRSTKTPLRGADREVIGLAAVVIDVTAERSVLADLKASEQRFRSLSEAVPAFIFLTDDNGEITYTNPEFQRYTGKTAEDLLGMGWTRTLHRDDRKIPEKAWSKAMTDQAPYADEYRFRNQNGKFRSFMCRATPIRDAAGQISQWVGTCSDVQDEIDAREAIRALNDELESKVQRRTAELQVALENLQSEVTERENAEGQLRHMQKIESIGQLTGGIAHDFNNMLAVVLGSLEIVKRRIHSDPDRALLAADNAEEGAKRAAVLTSRLLAFSRQQPLAPEAVDANKLVGGMSELLRSTIGEMIEIETVLAGGLWKTNIDAPQLENAILNLCVNARDAMPDGGKLTIETHNYHLDQSYANQNTDVEPGQYVLVSVSDSGTGMPPEVIDRAFDPFFTTKEVGKGTGLGLSQVYGFVKQSGGHVKIYSENGEGTTIKLYLPRHFGAAETAAKPSTTDGEWPAAKDGETILVVEDEAQVRLVSVEQLRDLGYRVIEAANGPEALELLASEGRIDLIFTDIVMPGMTGRVLADEAAKQRGGVKILYTTGYTRNAVVHNGILDPGTQFIAKPYTGAALAAKVRSVLDGR